jgi:hypothetical protein
MRKEFLIVVLAGTTGCLHRSPKDVVMKAIKSEHASVAGDSVVCSKLVAHQDTAGTDTAIVRVFQDCVKPGAAQSAGARFGSGNSFRIETDYLVVRRNGRWEVDRPIAGATIIGM